MKHLYALFIILVFLHGCVFEQSVDIPDKNLADAIRETLDLRPNARITKKQLAELKTLSASQKKIKDLKGIENATSLTSLGLYSNRIADITPLAGLTQLTKLGLSGNQISDITLLGGLTQLKELSLGNNQISDVLPLEGLPQLTNLSISNNKLKDITPLTGLTQLKELSLGNNQISDFSPLAGLTQLTGLWLGNSNISDISLLSKLTEITWLDLTRNRIEDISPLAGMTKLRTLWLEYNQISDISPLAELTWMNILTIHNNQISDITPLASLTGATNITLANNRINDITPLTKLTNLIFLKLNENQIHDVRPIENLKNLRELYVNANPIEDFTPIRKLIIERPDMYLDVNIPPVVHDDSRLTGLPPEVIARFGKGGINTMRFSPDSSQLAVGTSIGLWIYDVSTSDEKILPIQQPKQVNALAFSPDGKILASSGYENKAIHLWNSETGMEISTFRPSREAIEKFSRSRFTYSSNLGLMFSKDAKTLIGVGGSGSNYIAHWDVDTGRQLVTHYYIDQASTAAINPNANTVAIGRWNGKISLWDTHTGKKITILRGHARFFLKEFLSNLGKKNKGYKYQSIQALAFSPDGKTLASAGTDNLIKLWNTTNNAKRATLKGHTEWVTALAFSGDNKTVASGDTSGVIKLWDFNTRTERTTFRAHTHNISVLIFSPDGKTLASGSVDGTIRFWDVNTEQELSTLSTEHTKWVKSVAFSEDGKTLASVAFNGTVQKWDLETGHQQSIFTPQNLDIIIKTVLSPNASLAAAQTATGKILFSQNNGRHYRFHKIGDTIKLWDTHTGEALPPLTLQTRSLNVDMAFSPITETLAYVDAWQDVRLWDVSTGNELFNFDVQNHTGTDTNLVFSPDGLMLAISGGNFRSTHVWNVKTRQKLAKLDIRVDILAFSQDSAFLAGKGWEGIDLWKITPAGEILPYNFFKAKRGEDVLTFAPDGKILLTVDNNKIYLWDIDFGRELLTLSWGHTASIDKLVFSHDGKTLASTGEDGSILLWDWNKIVSNIKPDNR